VVGGIVLAALAAVAAADARCTSDADCAPWAVCGVSLGACDGDGLLDVCRGRCVAGARWRITARAGGGLARDVGAAGAFGVELAPPIAGGRLALALDAWTARLIRIGAVGALDLGRAVRIGARVDAASAGGDAGAAGAVRLEYFPGLRGLSAWLEGGALVGLADDLLGFAGAGLALGVP
jgi:hypothetical protein